MKLDDSVLAPGNGPAAYDYVPSAGAFPSETRLAIKSARVLCITFVMFVHVYTGLEGLPVLTRFDAADIYYHFAADVLGRSSIPLLTTISGWLLPTERPYGQLIRDKIATLLLPMVAWNLIMLAALGAYAVLTDAALPDVEPSAIFALTAQPANTPLGFLRDLFVVMLLSPLIVRGVRAGGVPFVALLAIVAVALPHTVVLLRTQILFFFALGVLLRHRGANLRLPAWSVWVASIVVSGIFLAELSVVSEGARWAPPPFVELPQRISVAALVWTAAMWLAARPQGVCLARIEPCVFLAYCSHFILFRTLSIPMVPLFGDMRSPLYPVYFTLQPVLGLGFAAMLHLAVRRLPLLDVVLNAGKQRGGRAQFS